MNADKTDYKTALHIYKMNEEANCHAENLVLLANIFGDETEQQLARMNLQRRNRLHCVDQKLNDLAVFMINVYYYELRILATKQ